MDEPANASIYVLVVIDTDYVKNRYPPNKKYRKPTLIDHDCQFMICADPRGINSGQGTADLNFNANVNDTLAFIGTSIYANSDDAVVIYGINYQKGIDIFSPNKFKCYQQTKNAVSPNPDSPNGLPAITSPTNFQSLSAQVSRGGGTENFYVCFALYACDDGETQKLFGYYAWDPSITVPDPAATRSNHVVTAGG
jgi:nematocidal protein AidA